MRGGSAYLDALLTKYHENLALALAAYNAGPEAVDRYHGIPPYHETRPDVARVIHEFNQRVRAHEQEDEACHGAANYRHKLVPVICRAVARFASCSCARTRRLNSWITRATYARVS